MVFVSRGRHEVVEIKSSVQELGAEGGTRTPTAFPPLDPEPSASANSATSAMRYYINLRKKTCQRIWRGESKKPGRSLRLFLVYLLDNGVSFHGAGDEGAVREDYSGRSADAELFGKFHVFINDLGLTAWLRQGLLLKGGLKQVKRLLADDRL